MGRGLTIDIICVQRCPPHSSTSLTPIFGWEVRGPTSLLRELWTTPTTQQQSVIQYLDSLRSRLEVATTVAGEADTKAKNESKRVYDGSVREDPLQEGDEVLVLHPAGPKGLSGSWKGPYLVQEVLSPVSYRLATPGKQGSIMHRNHLKRYLRDHQVNAAIIADVQLDGNNQLELPVLPRQLKDPTLDNIQIGQPLTSDQTQQLKQFGVRPPGDILGYPRQNRRTVFPHQ